MKILLIKINIVLFVLFLITSCNDEALEKFPLDEISNQTFWNTSSDLESFNNSIYNMAKNDNKYWVMLGFGTGGKPHVSSPMLDEMTDNYATNYTDHLWYV
ncbi:unnamed protein product, partial [marine sediment metagenome]